MESPENVCRLCLSVSPENMEHLFENNEIWNKISSSLKMKLQQEAFLPNGICSTCTDNIDLIHSFHQKVFQSHKILKEKLNEGTDSLREFLCTLKNIKVENIEDENICESMETDKNNEVSVTEEAYNNVILKFDTNNRKHTFLIKKNKSKPTKMKIEIQKIFENAQNALDVTSDDIKKEESDFDEDFAQDSTSEDNDWQPHTKLPGKVKKQISCTVKKDAFFESNLPNTTIDEENAVDSKNHTTKDAIEPTTDQKIFKCLTCFKIYPNRILLVAHFASEHKPDITVSPNINLKNFTKFEENNKILCKCGYCGKVSKTKNIKGHILVVHNKLRPYVCNICGKTFKRVTEIITHNQAHNALSLFCSYNCGYSSTYVNALRKHEMGKHRGEYKYKCECGKGFNAITWYKDHQNEHKGVKPYVCPICQQAYHYEKHLRAHSKRAHLKLDEDTIEVIRLLCTLCSHPCENMSALKDHLFKKHGIKKKYLCDTCGKSCNTSSNLHHHKREMHSDAKPFACSQCGKSFKFGSKLRRHQRVHTNERPHSCPHCTKKYARPQGLRHHLLTCHSTKKEEQSETKEAS